MVAERASAPLVGALGGVIGDIAAKMQRDAGVDLRTGVAVEALEGDAPPVGRRRITFRFGVLGFGFDSRVV